MNKLKDGIYGLAIGDALGVPVEFKQRDTYYIDDMIGYGTHNQPIGTWSDDTSMAIATCQSIKDMGKIDISDIRNKFECWYYQEEFTPFNKVFDVGNTCSSAIVNKQGRTDDWSNGNGSLMRILPLAFVSNITDKTIAEVSAITHGHVTSMYGCILYIHIIRYLLNGMSLENSIKNLNINQNSEYYSRMMNIAHLTREDVRSTGYIVDSFEAAIWCALNTNNYKDCVLKAVNLGDDTDTVGAIAGGLAGVLYGIDNIPKEWIDKLQAKDVINNTLF